MGDTTTALRQVRRLDEEGLFPWQQKIFDLSSIYDPRIIYLIVDEEGGSGKTAFCKWMSHRGHAKRIPATLSSAEDMMSCVLAMGPSKCFLIDFPRSIRKTNMAGFWTGIECLKNGTCYDKRYQWREMDFDEPTVFVFANEKPDPVSLRSLSKDRWKCFTINAVMDLQPLSLGAEFTCDNSNRRCRAECYAEEQQRRKRRLG